MNRAMSGKLNRRAGRLVFSALPALLLACLAGGCGRTGGPVNVLFIVVDTLRADRLGCYGALRDTSPAADALAAEGIRFDRSYTVAPWTMPSVATLMTGLYPVRHQVTRPDRKIPDHLGTLAEIFQESGYRTAAVISHKMIGSSRGFAAGFEIYDEDDARGHSYTSTPGVTAKARALLERFSVDDKPFFLFVHYFDPHYNFEPRPEFGFQPERAGRLDGSETIADLREMMDTLDEEEIRFLFDLYDGEIRFTDNGIAALMKAVRDLDLYDQTLVVFTSDHGEEFLEHNWIGHTRSLYEELMRVPLIIRGPGLERGRVVHEPVCNVTLAATILELAGLDPAKLLAQGASMASWLRSNGVAPSQPVLLDVDFESSNPKRAHFTPRKKGIVQGNWKLIEDEKSGERELYDLSVDPLEKENLVFREPAQMERLAAELKSAVEEMGRDSELIVEEQLTEEEKETLRGFGYIGSD